MKLKAIFKPTVILVVIFLIAMCVLVAVCSPKRVDEKLYAASDYMQSDNIALGAKTEYEGRKIKSLTDGKSSTVHIASRRENFSYKIDLGELCTFNTLILKEDGLNVKSFEIYSSQDGENYSKIFASDKIEYHRLCAVDEVQARYLRVDILKADDVPSLKEIEVYNEAKRNSDNFRVAGYVANSWLDTANDENLSEEAKKEAIIEDMSNYKLSMLTHIFFYCGVNFDENGNVFLNDNTQDALVIEKREKALALVLECMREQGNENLKISMTFGTNTGNPRNNLAMHDNKDAFITNIIAMANKFGFDGVDIDYEFPVTKYDFEVFDRFLIDLKKSMKSNMNNKEDCILSCAFGTRDINYSDEAKASLDFVNVMTYDIADQDGYHSSFWGCGPQASVYYESIGIDREKINLGIPFYGTQIHALMEQYGYDTLEDLDYYKNIYTIKDYLGYDTEVYFNSPAMVRDKTAYALLSGMGGIMVWHTTIDVKYESEFSLWKAIESALNTYGGGEL